MDTGDKYIIHITDSVLSSVVGEADDGVSGGLRGLRGVKTLLKIGALRDEVAALPQWESRL